MPPKNTASINIRLSKEADGENLSRDGMERDARALCERYGLTVVAVHIDDGISGAVRNRPGFVEWLDDGRAGRVDHLVAWHVDRMTREGVNVAAMILDVIEGKDPETGKVVRPPVRLLDTKGLDSFGDETSFRFRFLIAAEVARAERERMRDRSRAAHRRLRAAGRWTGGTAPFGFRSVPHSYITDPVTGERKPVGKKLEIQPAEAQAIRECAERVLAGASVRDAVLWMNSPAGHKPRRAQVWTQTTLYQVLTGDTTDRAGTHKKTGGHPIAGTLGEGGTCPAILTPDEAAALRQVLKREGGTYTGGRVHSRLLSGLLRCHYCDAVLQVSGRGGGVLSYRCPTLRDSGACNGSVSISANALDDFVASRFLEKWGASPEYVRRAHVTGAAAVEAAEQAKAEALVALGVNPTPDAFAALQAAQATLDEALTIPQETTVRVIPSGRTVREAWDSYGVELRRALLAQNLAGIIIKPGKRGWPGIDPARVVIIDQAPFSLEQDPADFRLGAVAV